MPPFLRPLIKASFLVLPNLPIRLAFDRSGGGGFMAYTVVVMQPSHPLVYSVPTNPFRVINVAGGME